MKTRNQFVIDPTTGKQTKQPTGVHVEEIMNAAGTKVMRRRVRTYNTEPSMTEQQHADDADANFIMKKYQQTGIAPEFRGPGNFLDLTDVPDLAGALQIVKDAEASFLELNSGVRERFGNNPVLLYQFLEDPKNREEAIELGLVNAPKAAPEPISVKVIPDPVPPKKD